MKNSILALAALCTFTLSSQAAQWTVSNNSAIPAQFTSLTDAQNAAQPGDTLYVQPSTSSYGNFTLEKALHIVGAGWAETLTRENTLFNVLTILEEASGSSIEGIRFQTSGSITTSRCISGAGNADNVIVRDCYFSGGNGIVFDGGNNNWLIENCIGTGGHFVSKFSQSYGTKPYAIVIRNCILNGAPCRDLEGNGNVIEHCIFVDSNNWIYFCFDVVVRNCIFLDSDNNSNNNFSTCYDCQFLNNISADCSSSCEFPPSPLPDALDGNITGVSSADIFVNWTPNSFDPFEDDFNLLPGSVAEGGGLLGVDIGVYGGSSAFKQNSFYHAWPDTPQILQFGTTNPTLVQGDSLQVGGIVVPGHLN